MKKRTLIALAVAVSGLLSSSASIATTYYVATTTDSPAGNDSNTGTSASSPWTITKGFSTAAAGDLVYIKGGTYTNVHPVVANSGTSSSRITFQGYSGVPVLDGVDYSGYGIYSVTKPYVSIKNLRLKRYRYGIWVNTNSHYTIIDGCVADSCCNPDSVTYGYDGYGIMVQDSDYSTIQNCTATDNGGNNIFLSRSHYCTIKACSTYSKQTVYNAKHITDYYIVLAWASHNVIRDSYCEDINGSYKGNHGFIIKDNPGSGGSDSHSTDNRFANCTAKKLEECFAISHQAYSNTVDSCTADNTGKSSTFNFCLMVRDGAYSNTFKNCTATGKSGYGVVGVYDGTEGTNPQSQTGNTFENCTFKTGGVAAFLRNSVNTTFKNCTLYSISALFRFSKSSSGSDANSGTVLRNCILHTVASQYETSTRTGAWAYNGSSEAGYTDMSNVSSTYTDFYNGFTALSGTGNISSNPQFASTSDYHLKSTVGRWTGSAWTTDTVHSPCIDAGYASDSYSLEPEANGNQINMGRYGNTAVASKSSRGYKTVAAAPSSFALGQNVPNPFNPATTISYTVASERLVTLKIFSLSGQLVDTLVEGVKAPGTYSVTWKPSGLASGVYFCRLQAGDFTQTNKMIFMK